MKYFLGVFEDGTVVFGKAETFEDFLFMATLGDKEKKLRSIEVTDVIREQNKTVIEFNPWKPKKEEEGSERDGL